MSRMMPLHSWSTRDWKDVGHASLQVCVAAFKRVHLKILAHTQYRSLGGRNFDEVFFNLFTEIFKGKYHIDVRSNMRASQHLRAACEKLKKVLSANPEAPQNIVCLMEEKDVRGFIMREEFEQLSMPLFERVKVPCQQALHEAGITPDKIAAVEVVGSGSRVPAIIKILTETFGKEPRRTMNASECVARGCALQCAILSPTFKVRDFKIEESFPYDVAVAWKGSAPETEDASSEQQQQRVVVFKKGNQIPSIKALTFYRSEAFNIDIFYSNPSQVQGPPLISSYMIGPFHAPNGENAKLKVRVQLDKHGVISVPSATLLEEEEIEVPVSSVKEQQKEKDGAAMETDDGTPAANDSADVNMQDAKTEGDQATGAPNGVSDSGDKSQGEAESKPKTMKKIKTKKTDVPVTGKVYGALSKTDVQNLTEKEFEFALQDRVMEETKEKKNAVEAYVYDMRNKLYEKYQEYVTENEKSELTSTLQTVEDWLYDEGEDEAKGVYVAKLEELKKMGDPIDARYKDDMDRNPAIQQLVYCLGSYRDAALSKDPKYDHIDDADKQKVVLECDDAQAWLNDKKQQQDVLPKHANPVLLAADILKKAETVDRFCRPIMTKPRPAPAKPPTQQPTQSPSSSEATEGGAAPADNGPYAEEQSSAAEPMETENPQAS